MRVTRRHLLVSAASLLAFAPIGCASVSDKSEQGKSSFAQRLPWGKKKKTLPDPYPNPVKLAATWTPDSLVQTGRTPTRGFGGRVFFYDEKSRPVPVDGTLVVHGFDETVSKTDPEVKRYEFTPEQFTRHFSQSDLGASYSVWIPWDALGGVQRKVSLVASFKTKEGKLVQGVPATVMLPGRRAELGEDDAASKFAVQYKEYLKATKSVSTRSSGLTTTTIPRRRGQRRGQRLPGEAIQPGITIPAAADSGEMIAKANSTPAVDLQNTRRSSGTIALPASAQLRSRR